VLGQIAAGGDPAAERKARREVLTLAQFAERYMSEHALVKKKASSARSDELTLRLYILPKLGALPLAAIARPDVARIHHELRDKPTSANRVVALLSKIMNLAELWGLRPDHTNPCRHIRHYSESRRRRFLSGEELARLGHALEHGEQLALADKPALDAIRLLLLTGARCGEILNLRWEHVDRERWVLRLPDSKTGAKDIPVGRAAQLVLKNIERTTSPWVIPGRDPRAALVNLTRRGDEFASTPGSRTCACTICGALPRVPAHRWASASKPSGRFSATRRPRRPSAMRSSSTTRSARPRT